VWAVPSGGAATIFNGIIDYFFPPPDAERTVTVSGTQPYDNAPGGWRSSMADMDAVMAPFGDIVALHPNHCFIPTTSALDFATANLFHSIAADPNPLAQTPFDAIYFPSANQPHVQITSESAAWLLGEILVPTAAPPTPAPAVLALHANVPNPFNPRTRLEFDVPRAGAVEVVVHDVRGAHVATLLRAHRDAGRYAVEWDGKTAAGTRAASGVYLCTLRSADGEASRRMVLLQ
jgi:hypothetical protein